MYKDCFACNHIFSCNFLNNTCQNEDLYGIRYQSYTPYKDYVMCEQANDYDILHLDKENRKSYVLTHKPVTPENGFPLCQWSIKTDPDKKIKLHIKRDAQHFQDFFIQVNGTHGLTALNSKELSNCNLRGMDKEFTGITNIVIRSKVLDPASKYSIFISTSEIDEKSDFYPLLIIISTVSLLAVMFFIALSCTAYHGYANSKRIKAKRKSRQNRKRRERTKRALSHMISGKYSNLDLKYSEQA